MRIKLTIAVLSIFVTIAAILTGCDSSKQKSKLSNSGQKEEIKTWLEEHKSDDSTYRERLFSAWDNEKNIDTAFYLLIEKFGKSLNVKNKQDSEFTSRLINTLPKVNSPKISHSFLNLIGGQYVTAGLPDSALHFYQIAANRFASSGHDSLMESTYMGKGQVFYGKASYEEALGEYKNALRYSSKLPEEGNKWTIIGYIGNVYLDLNENQKAADYYKLAADAMIRERNFSKAIVNYSSLTNVYSKMSDSLNGFQASNRALFLIDSLKVDPYSSFTVFYSRANLLKRFGKLDQAIEMYDKCINEQKKLNNEYLAKRLELYKVEVYAKTKKWDQAKSILTGLLPIAKKMNGDPSFIMDVYGQLARVENADGNYKESLNNFSNYYRIKDSIDIRKQSLEIARLDKEFQTKEKDLQIKLKSEQLKVLEKERNMWTAITILAVFIAGTGLYFVFVRRKQLLKKKEVELNEKYHQDLITATENEQARIALDLHDGVASELLVLKASLTSNQTSQSKKQIDEIIQDIRMLTKKLYPVQLAKVGLCSATIDLIQQLDKETDLFFSTEIDESLNKVLSAEKQLYTFRIIQEALNNILKHAYAKAAFIGISKVGDSISLVIRDNGKGFIWPVPIESFTDSHGILSIHHRAGILGAKVAIISKIDEGTTISLNIPIS
ncbi:MAG TPA: ATP-binding protein [Leadbetterella sp.]|nr:ATP-binding protein [Leadbetterella sp.]